MNFNTFGFSGMELDGDRILLTANDLCLLKGLETDSEVNRFNNVLYKQVERNRKGNSQSWQHFKKDGILNVYYDSIPKRTKSTFRHPITGKNLTESTLRDFIKNGETQKKYALIQGLLPSIKQDDIDKLDNYEIIKEEINQETGEVYYINKGKLKEAKKRQVLQQLRYIKLLSYRDFPYKKVDKLFRKMTLADFRTCVVETALFNGIKLPKTAPAIRAKLKRYEENGVLGLIPKTTGISNRQKIGKIEGDLLIKLYADPRKFSATEVCRQFNEYAKTKEWKEIKERAVRNFLSKPENTQKWAIRRHGKSWFIKNYGYTMRRKKPSKSDVLWVVDGTKVNYFYRKDKKTVALLNVCAIMDAKSEMFVGWAMREGAEDTQMVRDAMRDSLRFTSGRMPQQILYDRGGGNRAVFDKLMDVVTFPTMGDNPQGKTIELAFKRYQSEVMRRRPFFTGQNIEAKSINSKHNPELLAELKKKGGLPTLEEVIRIANQDIHIWNNSKLKKSKQTRKEIYESNPNSDCLTLSQRDEVALFWESKNQALEFRKDGIRTEIYGKTYLYEAFEQDTQVPDFVFYSENVGRKFEVKFDPNDLSKVALITKKGGFVRFLESKILHPMAVSDYEFGDKVKILQGIEARKKQIEKAEKELQDIENQFNTESALLLGYTQCDKETLSKAESDYWTQQERTDRNTWRNEERRKKSQSIDNDINKAITKARKPKNKPEDETVNFPTRDEFFREIYEQNPQKK